MSLRKWMLGAAAAALSLPAFAAVESYTVDPNHSYPSLEMSHMGISVWRGKFNRTAGKVALDRTAKTGTVEITVESASIDFGHDKLNQDAMGTNWLNSAQFPQLTYKGKIAFSGDTPSEVDGELTLRGVTKPLKLKINSFKCIPHPMTKKEVCGADAEGQLDRSDFGLTQFAANGMGVLRLRIQVEANKD